MHMSIQEFTHTSINLCRLPSKNTATNNAPETSAYEF